MFMLYCHRRLDLVVRRPDRNKLLPYSKVGTTDFIELEDSHVVP